MRAYRLVRNRRYGYREVRPTPSSAEIQEYYVKEFYAAGNPRFNDSSLDVQVRDQKWYDGNRDAVCENLVEIMKRPLKGLELLDVGCGWGQALLGFRTKGFVCYGFDPASDAVSYLRRRRLNVVEAGMDTMDVFGGKTFDVVTMFNVLEHLADPIGALGQIRRLLKPRGVLVVDVPNEFNPFQLAARSLHHLPEWWVAPPQHLSYFSPMTLRKLLTGAGYTMKQMEASFPMEMFLLFGHNYVTDQALGRRCHEQRMNFDITLRRLGHKKTLRAFYRALAELGLGRQTVAYAQRSGTR